MNFKKNHYDALMHNIINWSCQDYWYQHHLLNHVIEMNVFKNFFSEQSDTLISIFLMFSVLNNLTSLHAMPTEKKRILKKKQQQKKIKNRQINMNNKKNENDWNDKIMTETINSSIVLRNDDNKKSPKKKQKSNDESKSEIMRKYWCDWCLSHCLTESHENLLISSSFAALMIEMLDEVWLLIHLMYYHKEM